MTDDVLRPSWTSYRAWFRGNLRASAGIAVVLLVVPALGLAKDHSSWPSLLAYVVLVLAVVGVSVSCVAWTIRSSSITLTADGLVLRRRGRSRRVTRLGARGMLAPYWTPAVVTARGAVPARTTVMLIAIDPSGTRIRVPEGYWSHGDLVRAADHLGLATSSRAMTAAAWDTAVPGAMHGYEVHPFRWAALGTVVLLVVIVGGVIGGLALTGTPPFDHRPPRGVSAATVRLQDAVSDELRATLAAGTWDGGVARYYPCTTDDDHKGWYRAVRSSQDVDVAAGSALRRRVDEILTAHGLPHASVDSLDDFTTYSTTGDVGTVRDLDASVEVSQGFVSVEVTSACER